MSTAITDRPNEVRAASDLAVDFFAGTVGSIERTHLANLRADPCLADAPSVHERI